MTTPYQCPHCAGLFQVDPSMAGGQVTCPSCSGLVTVPGETAAAGAFAAQSPTLEQVGCAVCGNPLQVDVSLAGQQAACPTCGALLTIPGPTIPATGPALPQSVRPAAESSPAEPQPPQSTPPTRGAKPADAESPDGVLDKESVQAAWTPPGVAADRGEKTSRPKEQVVKTAGPDRGAKATTSDTSGEARADISHLMPPHLDPVTGRPKHSTASGAADSSKTLEASAGREEIGSPLTFKEPVKTVGGPEQERELQPLTRREKERRRNLNSLIMFLVGFFVLSAMLFLLNMYSCVAIRLD